MNNIWTFFAFPLNLLLALLWALGLVWRMKTCPQCKIIRFLLSPKATISALLLLLISCICLGVSGCDGIIVSIPFIIILLYVQSVLLLITVRGWRTSTGIIRWRFLLLHAGLLLAVGSGFWGAPDSVEMRVALARGQETRSAFTSDGVTIGLGYALTLDDYRADYSAEGNPIDYEAVITLNGADSVRLSVNHPYSVNPGEDIYLASVASDHCVLQIVKEPWRYCMLAGIVMLIAGALLLFIKGPRR